MKNVVVKIEEKFYNIPSSRVCETLEMLIIVFLI